MQVVFKCSPPLGERRLDEALKGLRIIDFRPGRGRKRARSRAESTLGGGWKAPGGKRSGMSMSAQQGIQDGEDPVFAWIRAGRRRGGDLVLEHHVHVADAVRRSRKRRSSGLET